MPVLKYKTAGGAYATIPLGPTAPDHGSNTGLLDDDHPQYSLMRVTSVISTNTTLTSATRADYIYICTAVLTATLPTAVGNQSMYTIKRTGIGNVTVATTGGQTIDGASTFVIDVQYMSMDFISDGANWVIV